MTDPTLVVLRPLTDDDAGGLLELLLRNRGHFAATEPLRDDEWFTLKPQRHEIATQAAARAAGRGLAFGVFADGVLAGAASRRPASSAHEKVGFRREGLARRYLRLAGRWTDQELRAITVEDALRRA